jgi:hypothetical protein
MRTSFRLNGRLNGFKVASVTESPSDSPTAASPLPPKPPWQPFAKTTVPVIGACISAASAIAIAYLTPTAEKPRLAVAAPNPAPSPEQHSQAPFKRERAKDVFARIDKAVAEYLRAAGNLRNVLLGRGPSQLRSQLAQTELAARTTDVSAAYRTLNGNTQDDLRELGVLLLDQDGFVTEVRDIVSDVLQNVHGQGTAPLNALVNMLNDGTSDRELRNELKRVAVRLSTIENESRDIANRLAVAQRQFLDALNGAERVYKLHTSPE